LAWLLIGFVDWRSSTLLYLVSAIVQFFYSLNPLNQFLGWFWLIYWLIIIIVLCALAIVWSWAMCYCAYYFVIHFKNGVVDGVVSLKFNAKSFNFVLIHHSLDSWFIWLKLGCGLYETHIHLVFLLDVLVRLVVCYGVIQTMCDSKILKAPVSVGLILLY